MISNFYKEFSRPLRESIELYPIEAGFSHPGETIIREMREGVTDIFNKWLSQLSLEELRLDAIITLVSRTEYPQEIEIREKLVKLGLSSQDLGVRDAAVCAVENWGDHILYTLLKQHQEPVKWLNDYKNKLLLEAQL